MTRQSEAFRARWLLVVVCRDCGASYELIKPSISDKLRGFLRSFAAECPESCPRCRNLKLVKTSSGKAFTK
jgi:transcription elongation factor Elf1